MQHNFFTIQSGLLFELEPEKPFFLSAADSSYGGGMEIDVQNIAVQYPQGNQLLPYWPQADAGNSFQRMPYDASQNHGYSDLVYRYQPGGSMPEIRRTAYEETQQAAQGQRGTLKYYLIGERPLDGMEWAYNMLTGDHNLRSRHQHFIRNDGVNFGFGPNGIFSENARRVKDYSFTSPDMGGRKLRADLIDEARDIFEKQKAEIQEALDKANVQSSTTWENVNNLPRYQYNIIGNNCQDYVGEILGIAQELARRRGESLYID